MLRVHQTIFSRTEHLSLKGFSLLYTAADHTFVICAYHDNPHLDNTICSLEGQTVESTIMLSTSTPSDYLASLCEKHGIRMVVNPHPHLAGDDWNYAYDAAQTALVTLAHQDDIYEPGFTERTLAYLNKRKHQDAIIAFTDYYELRNGQHVHSNKLLRIKRMMNGPLRWPGAATSRFIRRRALSVGDSICCPAVTFVKANAGDSIFDTTYINSCDYKTWVDLADKKGAFVYIPEHLMGHRIYEESATSRNLGENIRKKEDAQIIGMFWPAWIARIINNQYAKSEKSNEL